MLYDFACFESECIHPMSVIREDSAYSLFAN